MNDVHATRRELHRAIERFRMIDDFTELRRLAYDRLDEDWDLIDPDPDNIVRNFVRHEEPALTQALRIEVAALLAGNGSEQVLESLWVDEWRSAFDPASIGLTYRQWFEHVAEILRSPAPPVSP